MLTPAVLDAMSERIDTAWNKGAPERRRLQPDHTYSFDEATANNRYFSIMLYSLSIFKVILLMKKLWSSKAGMLMRIPFLFDNYKTYFSHNPTDNYGKFTATTAMDTETSISSDKERLANNVYNANNVYDANNVYNVYNANNTYNANNVYNTYNVYNANNV